MNRTTDTRLRREVLSRAVKDLRERVGWAQSDLADAINNYGNCTATRIATISRWERALKAPSPKYRRVLAKIASRRGHGDLAQLFRRPLSSTRKDQDHEHPQQSDMPMVPENRI